VCRPRRRGRVIIDHFPYSRNLACAVSFFSSPFFFSLHDYLPTSAIIPPSSTRQPVSIFSASLLRLPSPHPPCHTCSRLARRRFTASSSPPSQPSIASTISHLSLSCCLAFALTAAAPSALASAPLPLLPLRSLLFHLHQQPLKCAPGPSWYSPILGRSCARSGHV
jgi:hypothetical protein